MGIEPIFHCHILKHTTLFHDDHFLHGGKGTSFHQVEVNAAGDSLALGVPAVPISCLILGDVYAQPA